MESRCFTRIARKRHNIAHETRYRITPILVLISGIWSEPRNSKAAALEQALYKWNAKLPTSMRCFATEDPPPADQEDHGNYGGIWFIFPQSGMSTDEPYELSSSRSQLLQTKFTTPVRSYCICIGKGKLPLPEDWEVSHFYLPGGRSRDIEKKYS